MSLSLAFGLLTTAMAADETDFPIVMLELKDDPRYGKKQLFSRFEGQALGRPSAGAKIALREVKFHGAELGLKFSLQMIKEKTIEALVKATNEQYLKGSRFFLVDLPANKLTKLTQQFIGKDIYFFNISASDNTLRESLCQANLFHVLPSDAMMSDAIVQYLVSKKWKKVLLLRSQSLADEVRKRAFLRAAKRYGLKIVAEREFVISNDPRERQKNNISLLTGGKYDVIYVIDSNGEFAREVAYQGVLPRPVFGSEGLTAHAWHWAWERHGAPQLEKRFEKKHKRPMVDQDWAAWMAVKVIAKSVQTTKSTDAAAIAKFLTSEEAVFDGFKGNRLNFRPWNNQLRQPVLLSTHNWVIERAPLTGFLHQFNNLDTLGLESREVDCNL